MCRRVILVAMSWWATEDGRDARQKRKVEPSLGGAKVASIQLWLADKPCRVLVARLRAAMVHGSVKMVACDAGCKMYSAQDDSIHKNEEQGDGSCVGKRIHQVVWSWQKPFFGEDICTAGRRKLVRRHAASMGAITAEHGRE